VSILNRFLSCCRVFCVVQGGSFFHPTDPGSSSHPSAGTPERKETHERDGFGMH
jgi:hypothetical protein